MRILVLDDDQVLGRAIARVLKDHDVIIEHDASRLLEKLDNGDWFDLVFCDLHMPKWSGTEIIEFVKTWFGADAPICVLMSGDDELTEPSSADAIVRKPFTSAEMRGLVAHTMERQEQRRVETTIPLPFLRAAGAGAPT